MVGTEGGGEQCNNEEIELTIAGRRGRERERERERELNFEE